MCAEEAPIRRVISTSPAASRRLRSAAPGPGAVRSRGPVTGVNGTLT